MRDRLQHLHMVQIDTEGFSTVELDNVQERNVDAATASIASSSSSHPEQDQDQDQDLDGVLQEANEIRLEIQQIQNDISELRDVNYQTLNQTSYESVTKRDSNVIGGDIKRRGEGVLKRLHVMNDLRETLEEQRGASDPTTRIAQTQYQCLSNALRGVMYSYNNTEMNHRQACKRQIQRQLEVVGREVSDGDLEDMMESGELNVFSVQGEGKTARSALQQIESRHKELQDLERRIQAVQELFLDVAMLVEGQGASIENIQKHVQSTGVIVEEAIGKLERATASDRNNPFKKLFCGCFPCYYQ